MNRTQLFTAMKGDDEPDSYSLRTTAKQAGRGHSYNRSALIGYAPTLKAPKMFSEVIDYSTRRGVLPCYGITHHVLRNPPEFGKTHGLVPQGGQSRTQNPSNVNPRPLNLPIQIKRASNNAAVSSTIPVPGLPTLRAM